MLGRKNLHRFIWLHVVDAVILLKRKIISEIYCETLKIKYYEIYYTIPPILVVLATSPLSLPCRNLPLVPAVYAAPSLPTGDEDGSVIIDVALINTS